MGSVTTITSDDENDKKQTLKMQKKEYRHEKKRVARELVTALKDPTVVVMADWLKVRGTLRKWSRFYCVLKPGILLIYKSQKTQKHGYWVGTVLLNTCELIERPSKKDGFCFKLFHPLDQSIWATRGPRGESLGAVTLQPFPGSYLICRAASEGAGHCWMDALELSLRCSGLLMRTMHKLQGSSKISQSPSVSTVDSTVKDEKSSSSAEDLTGEVEILRKLTTVSTHTAIDGAERSNLTETEAEKHFDSLDDEDIGSESDRIGDVKVEEDIELIVESIYVESAPEQMGSLGDSEQTEEVAEENKSLVWTLMKQVRPGMDLSKVVLPTFILEPRSFLEKLADFYYHSNFLSHAVHEEDPYNRMVDVVRFYLSGFYKKPKGLKKPYNPILGEIFRCCWLNEDGSKTFYIAEQVSHHPPISAFFVSNRKTGFNISGTILAKSKFYGNSLSAMMNGIAKVTLLSRGESYNITLPYAYCKGLVIGALTMELGGQVIITCDRTSYVCELEFKLKPFLGGHMNAVQGKIKLGKETLAHIDGFWDGEINMVEKSTGKKTKLWKPNTDVIMQRLKRHEIPFDQLGEFESKKLWHKVTEAISAEDQHKATEEKTVLEEAQRERAKELKNSNRIHLPKVFEHDPITDQYQYIHADYRPWDPHNDLHQLEGDFVIRSISKHKTPLIRSGSVNSMYIKPDEDEISEGSSDAAIRKRLSKRRSRNSPQSFLTRNFLEDMLRPLQQNMANMEGELRRMHLSIDQQIAIQQQDWSVRSLFILLAILHGVFFAIFVRRA